jgi:hypothetical protein
MPRGRPRNTTAGAPAVARRRANSRPQVPFVYKLVLHQWLLSLFNVKRFEDLAEHLRNETLEGLDENNVHSTTRSQRSSSTCRSCPPSCCLSTTRPSSSTPSG